MDILGSQISVALQGIHRLELYDEQRDKLRKLHGIVDKLQKNDEEKGILQTAKESAKEILGFQTVAIGLVEGDYVSSEPVEEKDSEEYFRFRLGEGIAGKTLEQNETIWGADLRDYPEAKPTNKDFRAFISAPIGDIGVVQVISKQIDKFDEQDVELTEILADHLREELLRIRLEKDLRDQAIHDPLTGLLNRRYFNNTLSKEVERSERYGHTLAFLMADVNGFKEINDRYSHHTGDRVLQEVADLLQENVRNADAVIRYGGDEFLVVMPETNGDSINVVERLKYKLDEWNERSDLLDSPLTLAMGVSHWHSDQDRSVEDALKEADKKMYEDKNR
jgi:diguanylate cyclase (GGDEF)-like protein